MFRVDYRGKLPEKLVVYLLGDLHVGSSGLTRRKVKIAVDMIKRQKNARCVMMGDLIEAIMADDYRYNPLQNNGKYQTIDEQCKEVAGILRPIRKKCLAMLDGNHEETVHKTIKTDVLIGEALGLDKKIYGGRTVKIIINNKVKLFCTHGSGKVNSEAGDPEQIERNEAIKVKRKLRRLQSDCIVMAMGHIHKLRVTGPFPRLSIIGNDRMEQVYPEPEMRKDGTINEDERWYCSTGSF